MNDLISRQEIDAIIPAMVEGADAELIEGILYLFPSAQPQQWIPVTEILPVIENNVGKRVLVTTSWGMVGEAMYCRDHWEIHDISYQIKSVIAWMPLPEPWKGETR